MTQYDPQDIESILRYAQRLRGRRLDEIIEDLEESPVSSSHTKGVVGHLYERFFGIPKNSFAQPDFQLAGVELKIVPLRGAPSARRVKERTSITSINYRVVAETPFQTSHLDLKTRSILMIFYEWLTDIPMSRFKTLDVHLWRRSEFDEVLLEFAYGYVREKVLEGQAQAISEGATQGIGAATKGAGRTWVTQPFSDIKARPRAFAFKPTFTQAVWEDSKSRLESVGTLDSISPREFEDRFLARLERFQGMTVSQISRELGSTLSAAKSGLAMLSRRMAGAPEGRRDIEELKKMGIAMRTVRIDQHGRPREDVSFPAIDFLDVVSEEWESSTLREQLSEMLFVVFRQPHTEDLPRTRFIGAFFWHFDFREEAAIKQEWKTFLHHIREDRLVVRPQASQTEIIHIRPHGRDSSDRVSLPSGKDWIKSSFWLNRAFVGELIARRLS